MVKIQCTDKQARNPFTCPPFCLHSIAWQEPRTDIAFCMGIYCFQIHILHYFLPFTPFIWSSVSLCKMAEGMEMYLFILNVPRTKSYGIPTSVSSDMIFIIHFCHEKSTTKFTFFTTKGISHFLKDLNSHWKKAEPVNQLFNLLWCFVGS